MLEIGSVIDGKYKVIHKIGRGGTSNVYLVLNEKANKQWAVKEVRRDLADRELVRLAPIVETSILTKLRHPNLPTIIDVIEDDDSCLILMDYIEGITLAKKLQEEGAQPEKDVVKWSMQLCDVLDYLHSCDPKIIYRDMKPSNVMLKPDGDVVLIDFGAAREYKEAREGDTSCLGTKGYAAPEQFGGHGQTDERTDIYNLGATMYHLVTGHNPSKYPYEMYPIRHWDKSLSSGLEAIILKCTKQNPEERYQNCGELMYALEHYMELEEGYIRKQRVRMGIFISLAAASVACFAGSFAMAHAADRMTHETYSGYIKDAEIATTPEAMLEKYEQAISVSPDRVQAYEAILDYDLSDGAFTQSEAEKMIELLRTENNGKPNEDYLSGVDYEEFAYRLGLGYFYYYEGGNKAMSQPWFAIAKESKDLDPVKRDRAKRFYKVADYYASLSNRDRAGDNTISYRDYWDDLVVLTSGNLVAEDNDRTAYVMYRELLYQLNMHTNEFRKAGVQKEEVLDVLGSVRQHLSDFNETDDEEMISSLITALGEAESAVETAYGG